MYQSDESLSVDLVAAFYSGLFAYLVGAMLFFLFITSFDSSLHSLVISSHFHFIITLPVIIISACIVTFINAYRRLMKQHFINNLLAAGVGWLILVILLEMVTVGYIH